MNHFISLQTAIDMTTVYRNLREDVLDPDYRNRAVLPLSETFDRAAFDKILQQAGCEKLRLYFGMDDQKRVHTIVVGVNANDEDMLPQASVGTDVEVASQRQTDGEEDNEIVEVGVRCPDQCPPESPLNS